MASYSIEWKSSASKEVRKLPKPVITKLITAIDDLSKEPRPAGVRKLTASQDTYRVRVGDYRIIYKIFENDLLSKSFLYETVKKPTNRVTFPR
jgi:mRNA interferase RelE/StbE